jgi:hypothetical protein
MDNDDHTQIFTLVSDKPFQVEINGRSDSKTAIIPVHGFGVKRDSRGLFTEIEKQYYRDYLVVRGEFSDVYKDYCKVLPITTQSLRLDRIIAYIRQNYEINKFVFIGHSQGCLVIAKAKLFNSQVILLAPPIYLPALRFTQTSGWKKSGSQLDIHGESTLIRSDGSAFKVYADYWSDFYKIDAERLYQRLNKNNELIIIFAGNDPVLGKEKAPIGIKHESIPLADHDFKNESRIILLNRLFHIIH